MSNRAARERSTIIMALASALCMIVQIALATHAQADDSEVLKRLRDGRHVLMIRHAQAPGTGDPAQFRIGDCRTQRNLNDSGRAQARAIGDWFKARGISAAQVYSSQWCRCLDTATLMDIGEPIELPALNSFYELTSNREPNLRALREFLATRRAADSPIVLVTHQVTIAAISERYASSGEGILIEIDDDEQYTVRARLQFGD